MAIDTTRILCEWLLPGKVILFRASGSIDLSDLLLADATLQAMLDSASESGVNLVSDVVDLTDLNATLGALMKHIHVLEHPRLRKVIQIATENTEMKFILSVMTYNAQRPFSQAATLEEAIAAAS